MAWEQGYTAANSNYFISLYCLMLVTHHDSWTFPKEGLGIG